MKGMSIIVKKVSQLIAGIIFLYGLYIIVHGHLTPGGGFAGGTILSGAFILIVLAYGTDIIHLKHDEERASFFEGMGLLVFILLAMAGFIVGIKIFFNNYLPKGHLGELVSAGVIPLYNLAVGTEVCAALFTIFLALVIYKEEISK